MWRHFFLNVPPEKPITKQKQPTCLIVILNTRHKIYGNNGCDGIVEGSQRQQVELAFQWGQQTPWPWPGRFGKFVVGREQRIGGKNEWGKS